MNHLRYPAYSTLVTIIGAVASTLWAFTNNYLSGGFPVGVVAQFFAFGSLMIGISALGTQMSPERLPSSFGILLGPFVLIPFLLAPLPGSILLTTALGLFVLNAWFARHTLWEWMGVRNITVWGFVAITTWVLGLAKHYHLPSWREHFLESGFVKLDPLFHAAVAGQLASSGVVSNGSEGLATFTYHIASHWVIARLSNIFGTSIIDAYHAGYFPLILILILFGLLALVESVRALSNAQLSENSVWLGIWMILVGLLPVVAAFSYPYFNYSVFLSESFGFAIAGLLFLSAATTPLVNDTILGQKWSRLGGVLLLIVILSCVLALAKISVPFVLLPTLGYLLIRIHAPRWLILFYALVSLLGLILLYISVGSESGMSSGLRWYFPLLKFKENPSILLLNLWVFAYAGLRLGSTSIKSGWFQARTYLDLELLSVMMFLGLIPGFLMPIPGGSEIYFTEIVRWFAAPLVVFVVASRKITRLPLLVKILVIQLLLHGLGNVMRISADHLKFLDCMQSQGSRCNELGVLLPPNHSETRDLRQQTLYAFEQLGSSEFKNFGVFVPPESSFWSIHPERRIQVLLIPGITGLTQYGGMTHVERKRNYYGFDNMESLRSESPQSTESALNAACADGKDGIVLTTIEAKTFSLTRLNCH